MARPLLRTDTAATARSCSMTSALLAPISTPEPVSESSSKSTAGRPSLLLQRSAGVVLHITSLPGPHGLGDLGAQAWRFVDWLASAGQKVWQTLPINPVGPGDSPYQSPSAFAGSPWMVALEPLAALGWLIWRAGRSA